MDPNQFRMFLEHQTNLVTQLMSAITTSAQSRNQPELQPKPINVPVPQPSPLAVEGDMAENFEFFEKRWDNYSKAIAMDKWPATENARKVNYLLSVIGEQARKKYFNFELSPAEQMDLRAALTAIKAKVIVKRNVIVDRLDFFSAVQLVEESIDDFNSRLKLLGKVAMLGDMEKELITYKIVTANKWPQLRTKMLTIPEIDLEKAIDLCRAEQIATKCSFDLGVSSPSDVNKVSKSAGYLKNKSLRCKFCGDIHEFAKRNCPAFGKRCHRCKRKNHFEKVCKATGNAKNRKSSRIKEVKENDEFEEDSESDSSSEEEEYEIGKIYDNSSTGGSVLAELNLKFNDKWRKVICELDTGANTSLIGHDYLIKLSGQKNPPLLPSKLQLQSFGGNPIKVLGQVKIPCRRLEKRFLLMLRVVDVDHRPLLSARASCELGLVKFCNAVSFGEPMTSTKSSQSTEQLFNIYRVKAKEIIDSHQLLFSGYGKFPGTVSLEVDDCIIPSIQTPRRVPIALRSKLKKELDKLEQERIIVKETKHTEWVSNIVIVQRGGPGSKFRICLDPVLLNKAFVFITLDEVLPELGKARVFTTIDTKKGFWHVVLDEASSKLTTFWTPFGRYRWIRLPFGVAPAPEIFQIKLQEVIQDLKGVECIADDLLVYGAGDTLEQALMDHNICLEKLLCRLELNNVKLNIAKLKLCERSVKFYGHILTDEGLKPDENKIAAIRDFPRPLNHKEVHRFEGMVTYLGRFISNLSASLTNLRKLILKSVPWQWSSIEEEEFNRVKSIVSNIKTLRYYDVNEPLTIECDASSIGLGVVVYQKNGIVGYASRTLTVTEKNYAQIEKELLAILFACIRFDQLIVGNPKATVRTDHKPLISVFNKPLLSAPRRLQHMLLNLQRYNLSIEFVTGKENVVADALSRAPLRTSDTQDEYKKLDIFTIFEDIQGLKLTNFLSVSSSKLNEIMRETERDQHMQLIIKYIQHGWPKTVDQAPDIAKLYFNYRNELSTQDSLVFRNDRIVVPHSLRRMLIDCCHASHNGIEATLRLARANLFWPEWDFEHVTSASHHQQCTGKAEAAVKIAKQLMKKAEESGNDFWFSLLHWRNIPNNIGSSPASRLLSRFTRCSVPTAATNLVPKVEEDVPTKIEANRKRTKLNYDRKARALPELQIGSPVYVQLNPETSKIWSKGRITNRFNERSYTVNVCGNDYRRSLVHLKPRKEPNTLPIDQSSSCSQHPLKAQEGTGGVPDRGMMSSPIGIMHATTQAASPDTVRYALITRRHISLYMLSSNFSLCFTRSADAHTGLPYLKIEIATPAFSRTHRRAIRHLRESH
ncbi:uncharacterized protein LOC131425874 [Malaya genurostris]|uniref:uncharacterized protein LOC131425874 n=1 Tax=Malaya genurostris TaxID=325434 RepID=UPI0026F3D3BE|nr:uncharacterized protein LOC131425874 [Malaya genurostris]